MRLIFVRHCDPDYEHDSLTEKGKKEAEYLSERLCKLNPKTIICSPLGRAKATASYVLEKLKMEAEIFPWLQEFQGQCEKPGYKELDDCCWDWYPEELAKQPLFFDKDKWVDAPELEGTIIKEEWNKVRKGIDSFLEKHGYKHNGQIFNVTNPNEDTILIFCHLGIEAVIVSYLTDLPAFEMLHAFSPAPSSVTTLVTEERVPGKARFRILSYGDISHLYHHGEEPSFAARFCERYTNFDQRH